MNHRQLLVAAILLAAAGVYAHQHSAVDVAVDAFHSCLKNLDVSCVKPKALAWISAVSNDDVITITEDLKVVKMEGVQFEQQRKSADIFDSFEDFLQSHTLVAKVPQILRSDGPLGSYIPRSFHAEDLTVPLAATGRSKVVKKVILPFLLGLKFKTAVLVPLALTLIALKTWKALTLGLLSMVLTAAMIIFKFTKPKVVNYEVIHYPHHDIHHDHHFEHHVDHHVDHAPIATGWDYGHGRQIDAQEMAYNAHVYV